MSSAAALDVVLDTAGGNAYQLHGTSMAGGHAHVYKVVATARIRKQLLLESGWEDGERTDGAGPVPVPV